MEYSYKQLSIDAIVEKALRQDKLFITRSARLDPFYGPITNFKVVENTNRRDTYHLVHVLSDNVEPKTWDIARDNEELNNVLEQTVTDKAPKKTGPKTKKAKSSPTPADVSSSIAVTDKPSVKGDFTIDNPQLFECHVVGTVDYAFLGPYGNWVPEGENSPEVTYPEKKPQKAALIIRLDVPSEISDSIAMIDNAVKAKIEAMGKTFAEFFPAAPADSSEIRMKSNLFYSRKEWNIVKAQRQLESDDCIGINSYKAPLIPYSRSY